MQTGSKASGGSGAEWETGEAKWQGLNSRFLLSTSSSRLFP